MAALCMPQDIIGSSWSGTCFDVFMSLSLQEQCVINFLLLSRGSPISIQWKMLEMCPEGQMDVKYVHSYV